MLAGEEEDWDAIEKEHNRELFIRLCVQVVASLCTLAFVVSLIWARYQQLRSKAPAAESAATTDAKATAAAKGEAKAGAETKAEAKRAGGENAVADGTGRTNEEQEAEKKEGAAAQAKAEDMNDID